MNYFRQKHPASNRDKLIGKIFLNPRLANSLAEKQRSNNPKSKKYTLGTDPTACGIKVQDTAPPPRLHMRLKEVG